MLKSNAAALSTALLLTTISFAPTAAHAQDAFTQFQSASNESTRSIGYDVIDNFYDQVTTRKGARYQFRYSVLNQAGLPALSDFAAFMAGIDPTTLNKDEQLAYWLNFRNLLVIRAIAADLPGRSFKRGRGDVNEPGELWTRKRLSVNGVSLSIDDIEKKIILANWQDPNLLYGLYQGAEGGVAFYPPKNFNGASVHEDLAERGRRFVNARRVVRVKRGKASLPAVYDWYKDALFSGDDAAVIAHIRSLADDNLSADLATVDEISFKKMDYSLDEVVVRDQRQQFPQSSTGAGGGRFGS